MHSVGVVFREIGMIFLKTLKENTDLHFLSQTEVSTFKLTTTD